MQQKLQESEINPTSVKMLYEYMAFWASEQSLVSSSTHGQIKNKYKHF